MIEAAFRTILVGAPAVAALVADRVYFGNRPQNEQRASVVLSLTTSTPQHTHDGSGGWTDGSMRLDVLAPTYKAAKELAALIRAAIDNYAGTVAGVNVALIEVESVEDIESAPLEGRAVPTFGVSIEASFLFTE